MSKRAIKHVNEAKQSSRVLLSATYLSLGIALTSMAFADGTMSQPTAKHDSSNTAVMPAGMDHSAHMAMEDHSAHMKMMSLSNGYERSTHRYVLPDAVLTDANGKEVQLQQLLSEERPVILNFIFTSCTTVCPILSATLSQAGKTLNSDKVKPLMISISIDPEYDTPDRLRAYAARYHADENWHFLTGDLQQVIALQRAFNAYYGTKMDHKPVSFLRSAPHQPWVRLQGFTSATSLVAEYRALLAQSG